MNQPPDMITTALKMLIVFGVLLGGLVISLYFIKKVIRNKAGQSSGRMVKVLANSYIGVKKSIALVEVPGSILVLGITSEQIHLLTKIDDVEIMEQVAAPGNDSMRWSFSDHFQKISARYKKRKD
ncbi:MAG: flagellar biosynthetic protein FliO [Deltaproteobacteria bacterium]|nr:flagellar biosynthetic protein FliO [Deltaproteobacteria bacterium]